VIMKSRAMALAGCAALALGVAACGSSNNSSTSSSGSSTTSSTASQGKPIKVGLVTDIGGLNDRSFNHLAYVGLQRAEKELGIKGRVLTSKSNADYVPNLTTLAQQNYDLIIPVGFLMADATDAVAKQAPNAKFAIVDVDATGLKG
jgi:basic membrane protein A